MKTINALALLICMMQLNSSMAQTLQLAMQPETIRFQSSGVELRGWLFMPNKNEMTEKLPAIIMAPGISGVKECNYQFIAERMAKQGFAIVLFDYPNFGESGGTMRQEIDPWAQVQAYRDAISFITTDSRIDAERIGVWGGSYSGGHAIVVSSLDSRVKCFVAMTPYLGGEAMLAQIPPKNRQYLENLFNQDRTTRAQGGKPQMIPVTSADNKSFAYIGSPNVGSFIESFKSYAPNWKNEVTLKSMEMQFDYQPISYISRTGSKPKLFICAKQDELISAAQIQDAYKQAAEPKQLEYIEGHHFAPYMSQLGATTDMAVAFFKKNLGKK